MQCNVYSRRLVYTKLCGITWLKRKLPSMTNFVVPVVCDCALSLCDYHTEQDTTAGSDNG